MNSPLHSLALFREGRARRISSYDRTGANHDSVPIKPGETVPIARIAGAGCVRHLWFTIAHKDPMHRRNLIVRMYWDGMERPSVECPVGDFFGQGWGEEYNYAALPLSASPRAGRGLNCYFPMPFSRGAAITVENDSEEPCNALYYYIDYEEYDEPREEEGRFHAHWSRSCEAWRQTMGGGMLWGNEPLPKTFVEKARRKASRAESRLAPPANRRVAAQELRKQQAMLKSGKPRKGNK